MLGIGLALRPASALSAAPFIRLSATAIDENAAIGASVGTLSVVNNGTAWNFSLADDAKGMFALEDDRLTVGSVPFDRTASPSPTVIVEAADGGRTISQAFTIGIHRSLPALPLPVGTRVSAIGDSHIGYGVYVGSPLVPTPGNTFAVNYSMANGFIEWARALDPRFDHDSWYDTGDPTGRNISGANQGIFGAHLEWSNEAPTGIITRLPALLATRPAVIILEGGTNSINSGDIAGKNNPASAAEIIAKLDKGLKLARSEGVWVILMTIYPRGDWPVRDGRHKIIADANTWIRAQNGRDGVLGIVDGNDILAADGMQDLSMYAKDKIHLAPKGARRIGKERLLPILQTAIGAGSTFNPDPAVENLADAKMGQLKGVDGKKVSPAVTGEVPTGFRCGIGRNTAAVVCSIDDLGQSINGARLAVTPADNNDAAYAHVQFNTDPIATSGKLTAGDWIYAAMFVEQLAGDQLGTARITFKLQQDKKVVQSVGGLWTASGDFAHPVGAAANEGWWIKTNPFLMPDLPFDNLKCELDITADKNGAPFTVRLSRFIVRKVADPRLV